ncbi:MAG: ADP-ribosylation factor-like protein [Candidatus Thorarchaeota archaeon]
MIIKTYLIRISTSQILASSKYWPIDVPEGEIREFLGTRSEIKESSPDSFTELPLVIDDNKYMAIEVVEDLLLVYVTDAQEDERAIADKLRDGATAIKSRILQSGLQTMINEYEFAIESSIITKLKIALVGEGGVGKTTTLHLLLGDTPPTQYVPTIALNLETVENIHFGNYSLVLWDFAGQERFRKLWRFYFHGADVIFLVCDSSLRNVIISKDILKLIRRDAPKVPLFAIANKQDKPNVMKPEVVQKILGVPTYPMVAIDKSRRDEMLRILMNAAATYVGVALPDLPARQLLRFADEATEDAIAEVEARAARLQEEDEDYEEVEVIEEILVDEDGHVIEDIEDYEIIEEVVEEIDEAPSQEAEPPEIEPIEALQDESAEQEEPEAEGIVEVEPAEVETLKVLKVEETDDVTTEVVEEEEIPEEPVELPEEEIEIVEIEGEPISEAANQVDIEFAADEPSKEEVVVAEDNGRQMAIDLIFDALEADELISAEIEKVSKEELDTALEAFSHDEVLPPNGEEGEVEKDLDEDSKRELAMFLGVSERSRRDDDDESDEMGSVDLDAIHEIDAILGITTDDESDKSDQ